MKLFNLQLCCANDFTTCCIALDVSTVDSKPIPEFRTNSVSAAREHTSDQSVQRSKGQTKGKQNSALFHSNVLFFSCFYWANSKLTAMAARRNNLASLSELRFIIAQDTILSIQGKIGLKWHFLNWPGLNSQASSKHHEAYHIERKPLVQSMADCRWS